MLGLTRHSSPYYANDCIEINRKGNIMDTIINEMVTTQYNNTAVKDDKRTNKVSGRTIGEVKLSDEAAKYYEELKSKFSNMDFVLVSSDMKEQAKAHAASFANPSKMVVLIDEEKIERMATDEKFRKQYEGVIANAAKDLSHIGSGLQNSNANVVGYGMQIDDNGLTSYFAVLEKSSEAQRERIEAKAEAKARERKAERREQAEERLEELRSSKDVEVITASSVDELLKKIEDASFNALSDNVLTEQERQLGQNFDFSV